MSQRELSELKGDLNPLRLDIGCGLNKRAGHIGVDRYKGSNAEHILNIEHEPLPFADNSVDSIFTSHCLEHIEDIIFVMNEFWRVLKWGGELKIHVPHWNSTLSVQDPTHKRMFSEESFKFFCGNYVVKHKLDYGIDACFKQMIPTVTHMPDEKDGPNDTVYNRMIYAHLLKDRDHYDALQYAFPFHRKKPKHDWVEPVFAGPEDKREDAKKIIDQMASTEVAHLNRFKEHLYGIEGNKIDAIKRYGAEPAPLGLKGLFADLNRKHTREKRFLWDGEKTTSEHIKDTIYDHVVYLIMTLMHYEDEESNDSPIK